jgi:hypothetical protein
MVRHHISEGNGSSTPENWEAIGEDQSISFSPRLKHPMECMPFRPRPRPVWTPPHHDRHNVGKPRETERPGWRRTKLVAASNLGAVRINFRYASHQAMMASHSDKAGRDQFFEGHHETFGFRLHEISPIVLDLQYQPIRLEWETLAGKRRSLTLDWAIEQQDHELVFGEDKADESYFSEPDLAERLDFAEAFLNKNGAALERRVAGALPTEIKRRVVKDIFDSRRTKFSAQQVERVQTLIKQDGGTTSFGRVLAVIDQHPALSVNIAYAMMHRRHLAIPLSAPPMPDTLVTMPPHATKGALRAFLSKHVPI